MRVELTTVTEVQLVRPSSVQINSDLNIESVLPVTGGTKNNSTISF